ncbi:MAG: tetratricopeptide repeat protein, partial [Myxococcales bacterium]|nr:tetratricopeptide repeat protein [Myxococcales bacterium]
MDSWLLAALAVPLGVALGLALGWLAWGRGRYSVDGAAERTSRAWRRSLDAVLAGETPAAIEELTRLLQSQPDTVETYLGLGTLFRVAGDPHRAARIHKTVTVREALGEPMRREARLAVGLDLQAGGHRDEAIANLEALVSNASDLAPAWRALAELYEADGRHAKAYEALARHGKLTGRTDTRNLARLKIAEGESLVAEGQRSGARKAFAKAASIAPHDARGHVALARYHLNDGARAKAANASLAAVEAEPDGAAIAWRALV